MPLKPDVRSAVLAYVDRDLPKTSKWYEAHFDFVENAALRERLALEFKSARRLYKVLCGLFPTKGQDQDLLMIQARTQVFQYASIYEALVHHVLFDIFSAVPQVQALRRYPAKPERSPPRELQRRIDEWAARAKLGQVRCYEETDGTADISKVRFDSKATCASELGLIDTAMRDHLVDVYSMRNAIHIHAEIARGVDFDIDASKHAYWKLKGLCDQLRANLPHVKTTFGLPAGGA